MTNVVRFPGGRPMPATVIPRAEFERLACLALDVADRIVALLDEIDGASALANRASDDSPYGSLDPRPQRT